MTLHFRLLLALLLIGGMSQVTLAQYDRSGQDRYRDYERDRDRYRYDDYGGSQNRGYDPYDTRVQSQTPSTGYADLFSQEQPTRNVYGYEEDRYDPRTRTRTNEQDWRQTTTRTSAQTITGQIRELENVSHGDVTHRHVRLRTDSGQDVTIDLGAANQLGGLDLERGDRVRIMGEQRRVADGRTEMVADRIEASTEQRLLIERELRQQWVTGQVLQSTRGGFELRTDQGQRVQIDLGDAAQRVNIAPGARIQALGTLAEVGGEQVLLATQLRSLRDQPALRQSRNVEVEEADEGDRWENFGDRLLNDLFRD